jgi:hypothetical protein
VDADVDGQVAAPRVERAPVRVARGAGAGGVAVEQQAPALHGRLGEAEAARAVGEVEGLGVVEGQQEGLDRVDLAHGRRPVIPAGRARHGPGQVLGDGRGDEVAQAPPPRRRPVAGPPERGREVPGTAGRGEPAGLRPRRAPQAEQVGHGAEHRRPARPVAPHRDQPEPAQRLRPLQVPQRRDRLRHEQRVGRRQPGDVARVDGVVVVRPVAGGAGAAVAGEGFLGEEPPAALDELGVRRAAAAAPRTAPARRTTAPAPARPSRVGAAAAPRELVASASPPRSPAPRLTGAPSRRAPAPLAAMVPETGLGAMVPPRR